MKLGLVAVVVVALLALWRRAWRTQPMLAYGITIGILIVLVGAVVVGRPTFDHIPIWLPPLPFATVAVTLLIFGILAWVWDDDRGTPPAKDERPRHH
jgi:hypothetical protein